MPSDTPTPALTREQVGVLWERVRRPVDEDAAACGIDTWLCRFLRKLNEHHLATMTERDTLRSEVERLKALCGELVGEEGMRDEH